MHAYRRLCRWLTALSQKPCMDILIICTGVYQQTYIHSTVELIASQKNVSTYMNRICFRVYKWIDLCTCVYSVHARVIFCCRYTALLSEMSRLYWVHIKLCTQIYTHIQIHVCVHSFVRFKCIYYCLLRVHDHHIPCMTSWSHLLL